MHDVNVERVRTQYLKKQHTTSNVCRVTITIILYPILHILKNKLVPIFVHPHIIIPNCVPQVTYLLILSWG